MKKLVNVILNDVTPTPMTIAFPERWFFFCLKSRKVPSTHGKRGLDGTFWRSVMVKILFHVKQIGSWSPKFDAT